MSSISGLNLALPVAKAAASKGAGSSQAATSANDSFAALFAQMMATLSPAGNAGTTASSSSQGATSVSSDMNTLSQALASGNLSAAQLAFQSLQSDLQGTQATGTRQAHHHHHQAATQEASATPADASAPADPASSPSQLLSLLMA